MKANISQFEALQQEANQGIGFSTNERHGGGTAVWNMPHVPFGDAIIDFNMEYYLKNKIVETQAEHDKYDQLKGRSKPFYCVVLSDCPKFSEFQGKTLYFDPQVDRVQVLEDGDNVSLSGYEKLPENLASVADYYP